MRKLILILLIGMATSFVFASKGAIYGDSISVLEGKIKQLEDQNQELEIELALQTNCTKISEKAPEAIFSLSKSDNSGFAVALR